MNKFGCRDIKWSSEGMIRIETELMKQFFKPTLTNIKEVGINSLVRTLVGVYINTRKTVFLFKLDFAEAFSVYKLHYTK